MSTSVSSPSADDAASGQTPSEHAVPAKSATPALRKDFRFWAILVAMGFAGLLTALEATITSTALPTIIADLQGGDLFIWAANGYFLGMTALQPLFGQLANVFGRRWPTILSTAGFLLGSGICGGATNMATLIAGRTIQGVGAGGINVLIEIVICDLIPLRERGTYFALLFGMVAIGTALGPFFGGLIVDHASWRWVFYLNLPIGGVALVILLFHLRVNYNRELTLATRITSIDWTGTFIFVGAIAAILIPLSWAGVMYSWSSYQILVPLLIGLAGLVGFMFFEASRFAPQPTVPLRLFSNRTSASVFVLTFLHSVVTMWVLYFLPVYFQGVLGSSPSYAGVQLLPTILMLIPSAILGGGLMSKIGRYLPIHYAGYALMIIGFGLLTLLNKNSGTGKWVGFQMIESFGSGLIIPTLLPAVMAPLAESDAAVAAATWAFLRSFGLTWGTAIPGAIFNNRFDQLARNIEDPMVRAAVSGGRAYEHATAKFVETLSSTTRSQFEWALNESLRRTWQVGIGFAMLGFLFVFFEKEVPMRKELDTEFGIENREKDTKDPEEGEVPSSQEERKYAGEEERNNAGVEEKRNTEEETKTKAATES
ncbi:Efflux pump FUS6 [Colletotrichum fructicola]|nr:Efflux pump FUS6 [Colletotrichum fructicola]KAF4923307.1 Efflux pump FUS6 [Colletotrichum fructicola]KAF5482884.1 Efflux pump FUS6 [Colletotrichum fructicola]